VQFTRLPGCPSERSQGLGHTPWLGENVILGLILSVTRTHDLNQSIQIQINSDPAHPLQERLQGTWPSMLESLHVSRKALGYLVGTVGETVSLDVPSSHLGTQDRCASKIPVSPLTIC